MDSRTLRDLAEILGLPLRTVQRAAADGLIHSERDGRRRLVTSLEESYLQQNWDFLRGFRDALRTEPLVRLAVLFGVAAKGHEAQLSAIDLLVDLNESDEALLAEAVARVEARVGLTVRPTSLRAAGATPSLMAEVLRDGRVLVDRDGEWASLRPGLDGQAGQGPQLGVSSVRQDEAAPKAVDQGAGQLHVALSEGQPEQGDRIVRGAHDRSV